MNLKLFTENIIDISDTPTDLISAGQSHIEPGRIHPIITVEENIPGFKFYITVTISDFTILPDTEYNKSINPDIKFEYNEILALMNRWPNLSIDFIRRCPLSSFTISFVYYNAAILENLVSDFSSEGLYVSDIYIYNENNSLVPTSRKHREEICKSIGLLIVPLQFNGIITDVFQTLQNYANSSKITYSGIGHGARITFEPRNNLDVYLIKQNIDRAKYTVLYSPKELAEEFGKFVTTPENILNIFKLSNIHPLKTKKTTEKFAGKLLEYIKDNTGYYNDYYNRASILDEFCNHDVFDSYVISVLVREIRSTAKQMKDFIYRN